MLWPLQSTKSLVLLEEYSLLTLFHASCVVEPINASRKLQGEISNMKDDKRTPDCSYKNNIVIQKCHFRIHVYHVVDCALNVPKGVLGPVMACPLCSLLPGFVMGLPSPFNTAIHFQLSR